MTLDKIEFRKLPPVWFIKGLNSIRYGLLLLSQKMFPANVVLYEHFQYFWLLPCMRVAAELDIAGILKDGPKTIDELANFTKTDPGSLYRLMRALSGYGIFRQKKDGKFANSPMSKALIDGKGSLRHMIMQHLGTINWTVFNDLMYAITTGRDAFTKVYGKHVYQFLSENPENSKLFDCSMTNLTELAIEPLLSVYDFSPFSIIADIGGGEGLLLASILYKNPKTKGILFDLPEGFIHADPVLTRFGVNDRIEKITGNFFEKVPSGADAYLLKNVIHNWSDEESVKILRNVCDAMTRDGKLLLVEMMIDEDDKPSFGKLIDIQMLVFMPGAKERTRKEFSEILGRAGLKINRVVPTIAPFSIIEAIKS